MINNEKLKSKPEVYIMIGNTKISGNDLTLYHRMHMSSSYHCINCGSSVGLGYYNNEKNIREFYPCNNCGYKTKE